MKRLLILFIFLSLLSGGEILLIDHDGGGTLNNGTPYEQIIINSFSNLGYIYKIWDYSVKGIPPLDTLLSYKVVVWDNPAYTSGPFSASDSQVMYQYLNQGGKLFLLGPDVLFNFEWGLGWGTWPKFIGVQAYQETDLANVSASGVSSAPYFSGFSFSFDDFSNNSNAYGFQDLITLTQGAMRILIANKHPSYIPDSCIMLYRKFPLVNDTGRLVFFSASFEDISSSFKRDTFISKVIEGLLKYQKPLLPNLAIDTLYPYEIAFDSIYPVKNPYVLYNYSIEVKNLGATNSSLTPCILEIREKNTSIVLVSDTEYVIPLMPFEKTVITFNKPVYYNVPKRYIFKVELLPSSDANYIDNIFADTFKTLYVPLWDDFENSQRTLSNFEPGFERTSETSYRGNYSFCEKAFQNYPNMARIYSKSKPLDLRGFETVKLTFYTMYQIETGFDYCYIDISRNGIHFNNIAKYTGYQGTWISQNLDISGLAGEDSAYIRLRFESDPGLNMFGIFFDNLMVVGETKDKGKPFIIYNKPPDTSSFYFQKVLKARIIDPTPVTEAYLKYFEETSNIDTFTIPFDSTRGEFFYFTLPYLGAGKRIYYFFEAKDAFSNIGKSSIYEKTLGKLFYNHNEITNPNIVLLPNSYRVATGFTVPYDSIKLKGVLYLTYSDDGTPIDSLFVQIFNSSGSMPNINPILSFKDYPENNPQRRYSLNFAPLPSPIKFLSGEMFFVGLEIININGYPAICWEDYSPSSNRSFIYDGTSWQPLLDINSNHPADPVIMAVCEIYNSGLTDLKEKLIKDSDIRIFYSKGKPFLYYKGLDKPFEIKVFDIQGRNIKSFKIKGEGKTELKLKESGIYFINTRIKGGGKKIIYIK